MSISKYAIENKKVIHFFLVILLVAGISSFFKLGKQEDAPFTIKQVIITTEFPGATQWEVEELVTEVIEKELQKVGHLKQIKSESRNGLSQIDVEIVPNYNPDQLQQKWDEIRRRVRDAEIQLPEGAGVPNINDNFGDVLGMYYALTAEDGIDATTLRDYAIYIQKSLKPIKGVSKIDLYGEQQPVIDVEIDQSKLSNLGISPQEVFNTIRKHNKVVDGGTFNVGRSAVKVDATNGFQSLEDIKNLIVKGKSLEFRLSDIAKVSKGFQDPAEVLMRVNGKPAIGIAIANESGLNIVETGHAVEEKLTALQATIPVGLELVGLYHENEVAENANMDFIDNLVMSVIIVVLILVFAMGVRPSLLIGTSLVFAIVTTLVFMDQIGLTLNRTTLAAIIIAMGMLVDNAIVVADNAINAMKRGVSKKEALVNGASVPQWGLFGATFIAIFSFLPLAMATDDTAETIQPLFYVLSISLLLSWVFALTQTVVYGDFMLKAPKTTADPYDNKFFRAYKKVIEKLIEKRWWSLSGVIGIFVLFTLWGNSVKQSFFPFVEKPLFKVDYWLPNDAPINFTYEDSKQLENWLLEQEEVKNVSITIGSTPPRYYLASVSWSNAKNLASFLIEVHDAEKVKEVLDKAKKYSAEHLPHAMTIFQQFKAAPTPRADLEACFLGPDPEVLRELVEEAKRRMRSVSTTQNVRDNWREKTPFWKPIYSEEKARRAGISKGNIATATRMMREGINVGVYRERDKRMPILVKDVSRKSYDNNNLGAIPVISEEGKTIQMDQIIDHYEVGFEEAWLWRFNRQRMIAAQCDVEFGFESPEVEEAVVPLIESMELPEGYTLFWDGLKRYQTQSNEAISAPLPIAAVLMVAVLLVLFKGYRKPLVILGILPLIWVGIILGMKVFGQTIGFMAILGLLGLVGMVIKNAIVLVEQIEIEMNNGLGEYDALIMSALSRTIPVAMAAATTILGMAPIIKDPLFGGMAAAIMGGLFAATIATLIVLPILYAIFFNLKKPQL
ncbi:efflux RND transporter permease subunit [Flammeovirga agarivorans]|uniref:Efflux RND transporter permease subunit n=1 Tax=Flammeovirga agarivorans TaxID=2726742 RepID=A0A7X8SKA6_9BACT|nr:efflux RND transporter permease subunit [Flammeovirga agarivorans]NLR91815.1 efflux RND transporter permease subunit [Flammeovirga agarivorans]